VRKIYRVENTLMMLAPKLRQQFQLQ